MQPGRIKKITIVGGGTAGWMCAAALSHFFSREHYQINLIESEQIGTVGVGEATVPHIRYFNSMLGIDELDFMRATSATYKLGIKFSEWGELGSAYIHPFGSHGYPINSVGFHHYWLKSKELPDSQPFDQYSMAVVAAQANKFSYPSGDLNSLLSTYDYGYHIDAGRYAHFLRHFAEVRGVVRIEGKIKQVVQLPDDGFIDSLVLENGAQIDADLFIDCSGFRALLLGDALNVPFEDWQHWLPCDRAVAIPCERVSDPIPYTIAQARSAGWQWRIPLQHRTGNGHIYSSEYMSEDEAVATLLASLDGKPTAEPNFLRFTAGRRERSWEKNCIAIGLSSGFLEPLESTSIYLIQMGILKLIEFFPEEVSSVGLRNEYNLQMQLEYSRIRDFLILHYNATSRTDSEFWNYCRTMSVPESLARKQQLFISSGVVEEYKLGLFMPPSWLAVYLGQGVEPCKYDARLNQLSNTQLSQMLTNIQQQLTAAQIQLPRAEDTLQRALSAALSPDVPAALSLYGRGAR